MLDRDDQSVQLRLNSTVVGVRQHQNDRVEVDYVKDGKALRVTVSYTHLTLPTILLV